MGTKWQVKIPSPGFMAGIHSFSTRTAAWVFAREWEKAQRFTDQSGSWIVTTLRDGKFYTSTKWDQ